MQKSIKNVNISVSITSDDMLMVDFNDHPAANHYVRAFWQYLQTHPAPKNLQPVAGMTCMGFLTNSDDAGRLDLSALSEKILGLAQESLTAAPRPGKTVEIPICYDLSMAPDLEHFAKHCGISTKEVVKRHSSGEYVAQLIGFLPGFAYLGGLDPSLSMPRLATPRPKVPAGALGIAGEQCALYPTASPGGWNLIGRTPIRLFNSAKNEPCAIGLGDKVRFVEITKVEFERQWASR